MTRIFHFTRDTTELKYIKEKKYSGDNSHISETIKSFIKYLREEVNYKPEILVILEPTSPFRERI